MNLLNAVGFTSPSKRIISVCFINEDILKIKQGKISDMQYLFTKKPYLKLVHLLVCTTRMPAFRTLAQYQNTLTNKTV